MEETGETLLEEVVEVADHRPVRRQILRREVADRVGQAFHELVTDDPLQAPDEFFEAAPGLRLEEVVVTQPADPAADVGREVRRHFGSLVFRTVVPRSVRVAGNAHVRFPGVEAEELLLLLDREGVAASAGSACASGAHEPSHVLTAMGWSPGQAREAVRFTLGPTTTGADVDHVLSVLPGLLERLGGVRRSVASA